MSVLRFEYRDEEWNPIDRVKAAYDPHGRRMAECIERGCTKTPKHYLVEIDGVEMHTRLCDEHMWPDDMQMKYSLRPDPELVV